MSDRKFAVIGHPIGHTMSPFIHKRLFELAGIEGEYSVIDVAPEELPEKIKMLDKLDGYNITIPNKREIIPFLDKLDKKAELYGSVNTVSNKEIRQGYTTDPIGFLKALEAESIPFEGEVCIVGCGGVARTIVYEAALEGCSITLAVRGEDIPMRDALAAETAEKVPGTKLSVCTIPELEASDLRPDLLVNATPVGMYPHTDAMPVSENVIARSRYVFDVIYNPMETKLLETARKLGIKALGGMSMLVWQAVASHEIWDGTVYDTGDINKLILDSAEEMQKNFR